MDDRVNITYNVIEKDGIYTKQHFNELFNVYKLLLSHLPMGNVYDEANKTDSYREVLKLHLRYGVCLEARIGDKLAGFLTIQNYDHTQEIIKEKFRILSASMDSVDVGFRKRMRYEYSRLKLVAAQNESGHSNVVVIRDGCVAKAFRRFGIGRSVFLKALEISWERGYGQVVTGSNVDIIHKIVEALGMEVLSSFCLTDLPGWKDVDSSITSLFAREFRFYGCSNPKLIKAKL